MPARKIRHWLQAQLGPRPLMSGLHWSFRKVLESAGFKWEVRRRGDTRIGLWREKFRSPGKGARLRRLVFIHGFGDTPLSWLPVLTLLRPLVKKQFDEWVIFDLPGFGGFLRDEPAIPSMELMQETVSEILRDLHPEVVLGHSLGGWLAAHYAAVMGQEADEGGRYRGPREIILVASSGMVGSAESKKKWEADFNAAVTEKSFRALRKRLFKKEPFWFSLLAEEAGEFLKQDDVASFVRSAEDRHLLHGRAAAIRAGVWLLWGEHDEVVPTEWSAEWLKELGSGAQARCKFARLIRLPGIGHSVQLESPLRAAAILAQILTGKPLPGVAQRLVRKWWSVEEAKR